MSNVITLAGETLTILEVVSVTDISEGAGDLSEVECFAACPECHGVGQCDYATTCMTRDGREYDECTNECETCRGEGELHYGALRGRGARDKMILETADHIALVTAMLAANSARKVAA